MMATNHIRLVTFDALYTLLTPRQPIHVQYSQMLSRFLGVLEPDSIRHSFKIGMPQYRILKFFLLVTSINDILALKQVQEESPAYQGSVNGAQQ